MKKQITIWVAIASVSFAAIFIRLAKAPPATVASLRMIFSSLMLVPWVISSKVIRTEYRNLTISEVLLVVVSGIFLSMHFYMWIYSLYLTGVASSVVLVTLNPLFVSLYSSVIQRQRLGRVFWLGLALAVTGSFIIGQNDVFTGGTRWKGDLLAVGGAVSVAGYFIVGGKLRSKLSLVSYIFPVYLTAAIILTGVTFHQGERLLGYGAGVYVYCFLMALICQFIGHSLFNWALKYVGPSVVAMSTLGEPVGSTVLAIIILGEIPVLSEITGGILILCGITFVLYMRSLPKITFLSV
jgi:drug/metabolite transporter (DMT)-like permease